MDLAYYWRIYRNRPRRWLISFLESILNHLYYKMDVPKPEMVERAKAQGTHCFVVKAVWEPEAIEGGCWMAYLPDFEGCTQADTLPEALLMAGDWLKLELEYRMAEGLYPSTTMSKGCIGVWDGRTNTLTPNPDSDMQFTVTKN